jgi:hypothetical protein
MSFQMIIIKTVADNEEARARSIASFAFSRCLSKGLSYPLRNLFIPGVIISRGAVPQHSEQDFPLDDTNQGCHAA